ncbi:MAG: helicase-associated domain-containing protein [Anaerolineales bacterium]|nr:helicase-associated domain-containing protein [Anaerolineales bacterium]
MPNLAQSLQAHDLGHLRIVAEGWGLPMQAANRQQALDFLEAELPPRVAGQLSMLPAEARAALAALAAAGGRLPWAQFTRGFGALRELGAARRDKERPDRAPASTSELLWYRGLLGRAFFDTVDGPQEHAYLPDELLALLPGEAAETGQPFGRPARPEERAEPQPAGDRIVDQACTLLAGLRAGLGETELAAAEDWLLSPHALAALLGAAGLLNAAGQPQPEAAREFLEAPRSRALAALAAAWRASDEFNELRLLPGLQAEGGWENDPQRARDRILAFARSAPPQQWWSLPALIADVKARQPDFQRPNGNYDSWYLRPAAGGEYLRGFAHWDAVDGALIDFTIIGPLHALGLVDLARRGEGKPAAAFRWGAWAEALLEGAPPRGLKKETQLFKVDSQGKVLIPPLAPRAARYLLARFCDWLPRPKEGYAYQISAAGLARAAAQGLEVRQLAALLKKYGEGELPPNLVQALRRWGAQGGQARLGSALVLRVSSAAVLKALRASRAARHLGEPLGPTSALVKPGAGPQVLRALLELGYLGELEEGD